MYLVYQPHKHAAGTTGAVIIQYLLVTISGDPILYRNGMIYFKTGPIKVRIKEQKVVINFSILLLGKDKAVLKMPFLQKFNPKIDWIIKTVEIKNTQS